ncbi:MULTISPECIES: hypothetical protein [Bacillus cereus group]|uniref:Uncharacterized protein n=1 Tax=Bacillus cereus 03BB108 TaxID=451709 RepID=A0AAN0SR35_BACCE|nr:hypothetical protein [Bacillus cereus]HDR7252893.1 hypothetical protein [Bacillus pacificus]AJI08930.1 hypothetical protein AK40_5559 [Bacillus cereus 03BB108]EDX60036.1 conserved hypothetical protein [Bacillus cereus 03BB108]ONG75821.1 hypothetical protein BKK44_01185 [Bacillus cereus]QKG99048.1 hypothetical protein FOC96_02005 [Bacillus cereus]
MSNTVLKAKAWLASEKSQVSNESGMHNLFVVLLVIGLGALVFPQIKSAFDSIMAKFTTAATSGADDVHVDDPLGKTSGWGSN